MPAWSQPWSVFHCRECSCLWRVWWTLTLAIRWSWPRQCKKPGKPSRPTRTFPSHESVRTLFRHRIHDLGVFIRLRVITLADRFLNKTSTNFQCGVLEVWFIHVSKHYSETRFHWIHSNSNLFVGGLRLIFWHVPCISYIPARTVWWFRNPAPVEVGSLSNSLGWVSAPSQVVNRISEPSTVIILDAVIFRNPASQLKCRISHVC